MNEAISGQTGIRAPANYRITPEHQDTRQTAWFRYTITYQRVVNERNSSNERSDQRSDGYTQIE